MIKRMKVHPSELLPGDIVLSTEATKPSKRYITVEVEREVPALSFHITPRGKWLQVQWSGPHEDQNSGLRYIEMTTPGDESYGFYVADLLAMIDAVGGEPEKE